MCQDTAATSVPDHTKQCTGHAHPVVAGDRAEARYQMLFAEATDPMCVTALDGTLVDVNAAFCRVFGFATITEAVGHPILDVYTDPHDRKKLLAQVLDDGIARDRTVRLRTLEGAPRTCRVTAWVRWDTGGDAVGFQSILRSSARVDGDDGTPFRHAIENAQDVVTILDEDGTVVYSSPSVETVLGYRPADRVGLSAIDLVAPAQQHEVRNLLFRGFMTGAQQSLVVRMRHRDGSWRHLHAVWKCFRLPDGSNRAVVTSRDVTDLLSAQTALREQEEFLATVLENVPSGIFVKDARTLRVLRVNRAVEEALGVSQQELRGRRVDEVLDEPGSEGAIADSDRRARETGEIVDVPEARVVRRDGEERMFRVRKCAIPRDSRDPDWIVGIAEDITDLRRLQSELERKDRLSALGMLVSAVAHELANPLTSLMCSSQLLETVTDLPDRAATYASRIGAEAERARRIVTSLLTLARTHHLEPRATRVDEILLAVKALRAEHFTEEGLELRLLLDPAVPEIEVDPDQIKQAVLNLVLNAEHALASAGAGGLVEISTAWDPESSELRIAVRDDGPGMTEETLARAFEPFFTTRRNDGGTGLGLSIARSIAEDHDGSLDVATSPGAGTTMTVRLPGRHSSDADAGTATPGAERAAGRILVVDDEPIVCELVAEVLRDEGHDVVAAADGLVALGHLEAGGHFDVVLSDVGMPRMDGVALFGAACERGLAAPEQFILTTGALVSDKVRRLESQGASLVMKPFHVHDVTRAVARVLSDRAA